MPSGDQRKAIEQRVAQLERMAEPGPEDRALKAITKLLVFYAPAGMSEQQAAVRAGVYLEALDDMPAWTIDEAVRRWFKGKCGDQRYDFAPSPAALREVVESINKIAAGQRVVLERILAAKALPDMTDVDRAAIAEKALLHIKRASGGTVVNAPPADLVPHGGEA